MSEHLVLNERQRADLDAELSDMESLVGSRRYLYMRECDGATYTGTEDAPDNFWWRCVAAGSIEACKAAQRLLT